jgi:adenosylcobinamide-GDP ribazoletransferase
LHLDGVADVFDALGGGRGKRDRMLAIMRDSRIGAHGAVALVLLLAAKLVAVAVLVRAGATWTLYACPIAARWAVVWIVVGFPYARPDGLGRAFNGHGRAVHVLAATCVATLALAWLGPRAVMPAVAALASAVAVGVWLWRHLGGLTGDVYGAAIEVAEVSFLIVGGCR